MLARRIAAATTAAVLAAPAAANAAPIIRHASGVVALIAKPTARLVRAQIARRADRRSQQRLTKPARASGR